MNAGKKLFKAVGSLPALAEETLVPAGKNNLSYYLTSESSIVATPCGYVRLFYDEPQIVVEEYNDAFVLQERKILNSELDIYGGFFSGNDAYYFVFGQSNLEEDTSKEIIRVVKYDKDWNRGIRDNC